MEKFAKPSGLSAVALSLVFGGVFFFRIAQQVNSGVFRYLLQDRTAAELLFKDFCVLSTLLASCVFLLGRSSRIPAWLYHVACLSALVFGLSPVLLTTHGGWLEYRRPLAAAIWVCAVLGGGIAYFRFAILRTALRNILIFWLPFVLFGLFHAWQRMEKLPVRREALVQDVAVVQRTARNQNASGPHPVLWIIFDEMDQKLVFESSLSDRLIQLKDFRQHALAASAAVPAGYWTLAAVPSMLTGQILTVGTASEPNDASGAEGSSYWATKPNLFSELHSGNPLAPGVATSLAGWYHPYCSVLGNAIDRCFSVSWDSPLMESYERRDPPMRRDWMVLFDVLRFFPLLPESEVWKQREQSNHAQILRLLNEALPTTLQPLAGFTLLHFPVPHPPGVDPSHPGYVGNLLLADQLLGRVKEILVASGQWESTNILITGDHHLRMDRWGSRIDPETLRIMGGVEDARAVFLFKPAYAHDQRNYSAKFNLTLVHDLVLATASGVLKNTSDIANWLDRNRSRFPVSAPHI